jgi:hypothetical protein
LGEAYELADIRDVQTFVITSAADALFIPLGPVPRNTIWTVTAARGEPSVNETRVFWFSVQPAGTIVAIPVTWPTSLAAVVANQQLPAFVKEGMEFRLYPGERFYIHRDAATAGSTLTLHARVIVSDLPIFHYTERLERSRQRKSAAQVLETVRRGPGGGGGGFVGSRPGDITDGGGREK